MSNEVYKDLVDYAYSLVNIINKKYLRGIMKAYPLFLLGIGSYRVESRPGNGHNYQAIIDAMHLYNTDYPDSKVDEGFEAGILDLINSVARGAGFGITQLVINCINYELKKEKEGSNSFKLDCKKLLDELNKAIQKNYDQIKEEYVHIDKWLIDNSTFIEENYGYKFY